MRDRDYNDSIAFLSQFFALTESEVELRAIAHEGGARGRVFTRNPDDVVAFLRRFDVPGTAVYFGCCTRAARARSGRREDLAESIAAWVDIDTYKLGISVDDAVAALRSCPFPPTVIVLSGGGVHAYWLWREPILLQGDDEPTRLDAVLGQLAGVFCGDPLPAQIAAVMRLPGSHNSKPRLSPDGSTVTEMVECVVLEAAWTRWELGDLEEALFRCRPLISAPAGSAVASASKATISPLGASETDPFLAFAKQFKPPVDVERMLRDMTYGGIGDTSIHRTQLLVSGSLANRPGWSDEAIVELLMARTQEVAPVGNRWNWKYEERAILKMTLKIREDRRAEGKDPYPQIQEPPPLPEGVIPFELRPKRQEKPEERPDDDPLPARPAASKPTIPIKVGQIAAVADAAEKLLVDAAAPFYSRTSSIVRPVIEEDWAADGIKTKVARLVPITEAGLIDYLSRLGSWVSYSKTAKEWVPADPPKSVAQIVLSREGEWLVPPVAGVITTPTMRPDGSILREEGYDAATRLVLLQPPPMPIIPPQPSKDDAAAALALLSGLLTEFCFTDEPSRSVAMSALMTPVVRGALPVAPAHVARAPVAGSGKSYLVDIAAVIATGQRCPVITAGKSEEEAEKRIGAVLLGGQSIVSIDNLNGELRGDALCQMVERPLVQIRVLGKSVLMRVESRATLFATGNNIVVVGDMVRRTLMMSMDADVERPENRTFKQRPVDIVLADRGRYIAAVLTIVRAYAQAGYPGALPPLASYDKWSLLVRSALAWLGMADPVLSMETTRSEDPELSALRDFINGWCEAGGLHVMRSPSEIIALAEQREYTQQDDTYQKPEAQGLQHPEFYAALTAIATGVRGPDPRKLGWWLGRQKNRQIDGLKIVGDRDSHTKNMRWRLIKV